VLAACSGGGSASPSPSPGATPTPAPTTGAGAVLVTIEVSGERYRIRLTDPADIAIARTLLAGGEAPGIPNGRIVRGEPDVNEGFGWHIDPDDFEWADMTTEVCDGRPSFVEDGSLTGDRFCPWSATVVAVEAAS
jgi:hypothetical protein